MSVVAESDVEMSREYHPVADIFPLMQGDEFDALKEDIATNGLRESIWLHPDGRILDGRNRHRACIETQTAPRFRTWDGRGSLVAFVVSLNLHRRHLTASQRATVAVDVLPMLEEEARERQATSAPGIYGGKPLLELFPEAVNGNARDHAATLFQTNGRYVQDAKSLADEAPDLFERVRVGEMTIPQAKRERSYRERAEAPALPSDRYRIIYADPPWRYGNTMPDYMGVQDDHYPTMPLRDICELPVRDLAEDDAVLFLWVTSPILKESFEVIRAWGFEYKASFVWDKVRHVMGHYNSVRHELLLVCTRGSCQPDVRKLFDSVQSIERTAHSAKPEVFREMIDTLYPHGRRIELFARARVENWEVWGNESGC